MDRPRDGSVHHAAPKTTERLCARVSFGTGSRTEKIQQTSHGTILTRVATTLQRSIWLLFRRHADLFPALLTNCGHTRCLSHVGTEGQAADLNAREETFVEDLAKNI